MTLRRPTKKTVGIVATGTALAGIALAGIRGCGEHIEPPEPVAVVSSDTTYHAPATLGGPHTILSGGALEKTPSEGAMLTFPSHENTWVSLPGGTRVHIPSSSAGKIVVNVPKPKRHGGTVELTVENDSTIKFPAGTEITHAGGSGSTTLKEAGDVELKPGETAKLPGGTHALDIPPNAGATVTISGGYITAKLPADSWADVPGACEISLPADAVVRPVTERIQPTPPTPPTPAAPPSAGAPAAPPAPGAGAAPPSPLPPPTFRDRLLTEVDSMLGPGVDAGFHSNVQRAISKLLQGLKTNRAALERDPQFWLTLGELYGSVDQSYYGQPPARTSRVQQSREFAMGCFNNALGLDPNVRNTTMRGHSFSEWYNGVGDTLRAFSVSSPDALRVEVKPDGSIALKR